MISFLFVDTERVWRGGQEQLFTLLSGLSRRGHEIHLACPPEAPLAAHAADERITVHPLRMRSEVSLPATLRLMSILRRVRPQILAFNTPRAILAGTVASRFSSSVRGQVIFRRVQFPLRRSLFTRLKYRWGIDCIITNSEAIRRQLQADGLSLSRIRTVYEGVDLSRFPQNSDYRRPGSGPLVVGNVAHMSPEKGLNYLVEAAALIPEVRTRLRFVLVGDGRCLPELKDSVRKLALGEIFEFPGFQSNTLDFFRRFDIFVLPSLSEGLPSAILEAMASSLPVVASRTGGIPELVIDGETGLLIPPADAAALARAIDHLAGHPDAASQMGQRGRARVEEQFTMERKILDTENICESLLRR